jgi:flavin-dependent dehydrogenase
MTAGLVIVGGGVAGACAALSAARAGLRPRLLERRAGPHDKVCGEFLSWEAADRLRGLGVDPAALGAAPIRRVRLRAGSLRAEAALPRTAWGLSRRTLDAALLAAAARAGARVDRGTTVRRALRDGDAFAMDLGGAALRARRLVLATGKTPLRGLPRRADDQPVTDGLVGFKAHLRLTPAATAALRGAVELHLLPGGGYAGFQLVEGDLANLCALLPRGALPAAPGWDSLVAALAADAPALADALATAEPAAPRPLAVAGVPYGFVHRDRPDDPPGLARVGDQFAVTHSFTGDGMSIAVATGALAGAAPGRAVHAAARAGVGGAVRMSSALHGLLAAPGGRWAAAALAAACPPLLGAAARWTRVRDAV